MEAHRFIRPKAEVQVLSVPVPDGIDAEELRICLNVLQQVADDPAIIDQHARFKTLIAKIHREGQRGVKNRRRQALQAEDRIRTEQTGIIQQQQGPISARLIQGSDATGTATMNPDAASLRDVLTDQDSPTLNSARQCYVCKQHFTTLHAFYHLLCPLCSELNWTKRQQRADLTGRRALVTGGRIKIGFQTVLKLLRDGARVLVTTRFPHDAAHRFSQEPDFETWSDKIEIQGLDLRDLVQVEAFASQLLERGDSIDILIHNAAQTVKRPLAFYRHLLEASPPDVRALS
ncbi:MAG: short chain dehydrogenase/reductase family oxidoreductase [Planctomycetaceae bacterium]|nr:short chain dehydrogenase/reductase family oxidoreductase [Planctomycetaceae bacterium]